MIGERRLDSCIKMREGNRMHRSNKVIISTCLIYYSTILICESCIEECEY